MSVSRARLIDTETPSRVKPPENDTGVKNGVHGSSPVKNGLADIARYRSINRPFEHL
jgi:hypothetical protein